MITIGIDPGWASFGISVIKDRKMIGFTSYVPKDYLSLINFIGELNHYLLRVIDDDDAVSDGYMVYIERFVVYGGVQVDPENILMLIGALDYYFSMNFAKPKLVKALDWKVKMCHHLVKTTGESNPSTKLDKKFSLWAAEKLSGIKFKSDHEADAVCLSYLTEGILK